MRSLREAGAGVGHGPRAVTGGAAILGLLALLALVAAAAGGGPSLRGDPAELSTPQLLVDYAYSLILVVVVGLCLAMVALILMSRRAPLPQRRGSAGGLLAGVALVALAVGASRFLDRDPPASGEEGIVRIPDQPAPLEPLPEQRRQQLDDPSFRWEVAAAAAGAAAIGAVLLLRRSPREELDDDGSPEAARAVSGVLDEALDDLRAEQDARRAVIAAYARLETTLAHYGLARRPAEAPLEYLARVLLELRVRPAAVLDLTELFEQAKFSRRRIDAAMKHEAIEALAAVRDDLRAAA